MSEEPVYHQEYGPIKVKKREDLIKKCLRVAEHNQHIPGVMDFIKVLILIKNQPELITKLLENDNSKIL